MERKSLEDFNNNYQAYANYLESAKCADDDGYDIYADEKGNIYERTNGSWENGHGHNNVYDKRDPRDPNDSESIGRKWKNNWLKYVSKINLNDEEKNFSLLLLIKIFLNFKWMRK